VRCVVCGVCLAGLPPSQDPSDGVFPRGAQADDVLGLLRLVAVHLKSSVRAEEKGGVVMEEGVDQFISSEGQGAAKSKAPGTRGEETVRGGGEGDQSRGPGNR